jgi:sugar/nucleoside kinase (ribokinase family)
LEIRWFGVWIGDHLDALTIGEVLVEFIRKGRDSPHYATGEYAGPFASGAPAIFADASARLGLKSGIIGAVGKDDFGKLLVQRLGNDGVNIAHLLTSHAYTTGIAFVTYYSDGRRQFLYHLKQSAAANVKSGDVLKDFVKSFRVLHVMGSTLSLGDNIRKACYKAVRIAHSSGMIITYDPNLRAELLEPRLMRKISRPLLNVAEIVIPSKAELFDLTGKITIEEASRQIFKYGVEDLIIKLGNEGSVAITKQGRVHRPAYDVQEVDATGAGDAFDAAIIHGYLRKEAPEALLDFANAVGALKVTKTGPMEVPASIAEVTSFMKESKRKP